MQLSLNYDRPEETKYFKSINLHNLIEKTDKNLGIIDSNETARLYYRSDLWEKPSDEGITTDVVSNFNLILAFSTQKTSIQPDTETDGDENINEDAEQN